MFHVIGFYGTMKRSNRTMFKKFKRKNTGNKMGVILLILSLLFFHTFLSVNSDQNTIFHGAAGEIILEGKVIGNTLDLDWTPYPQADFYIIYHSDTSDSLISPENTMEETKSFGLSITPFTNGYYAVSAKIGPKTLESNIVPIGL